MLFRSDIETMRLEITDHNGFHYVYAWEYVFATDTFTMYLADEMLDEQTIYVVKDEIVSCYQSTYTDTTFYNDPYAEQYIYYADQLSFAEVIELFVSYSVPLEGIRYKRTEDVTLDTGDAYSYEIYRGDAFLGYLLVDKASGLMVCLTNEETKVDYLITKIDPENAGIPKYK